MKLLESVLRWVARNFASFVVIVVILAAANYLQNELKELYSVTTTLSTLRSAKDSLTLHIETITTEARKNIPNYKNASLQGVEERLKEINKTIQIKASQQRSEIQKAKSLLTGEGISDDFKVGIEIYLLEQERDYLNKLQSYMVNTHKLSVMEVRLEQLRKAHVLVYQQLQQNIKEQVDLRTTSLVLIHIPGTAEHNQLNALEQAYITTYHRNQLAYREYQSQNEIVNALKNLQPPTFDLQQERIDSAVQVLNTRIAELDNRFNKSWLASLSEPVSAVIPTAIGILLSIILAPIGIKAFLYFVIAPLASRRPAICVLQSTSGSIDVGPERETSGGGTKISVVSIPIHLNDADELLVHPEYLQSSSCQGTKVTKWLLDNAYPLSSLASGMFALTRIRSPSFESFVLSDTRDPLNELSVISIPSGSAIVCQPHCLIGIVQGKTQPISISSHWRLASLHAWLTLQLRFLVFHGPAKLIVKGCRGIRVERAGSGRSINQAATIGFSANIAYSNTRCETFASYLMGKQELFNDRFVGTTGFYIYEETPHFGKKVGIAGRGIEGIIDSFLKIFGI